MKTIASKCDFIGKDIVSFELAKTLKKLGYNQNVSNFVYDDKGGLLYIGEYFHHNINIDEFEYFDAPTISELLSEVPYEIGYDKNKNIFLSIEERRRVCYKYYEKYIYEQNNNCGLADNLAKMWIFLKEEGYNL
jgi:hypothetical protein